MQTYKDLILWQRAMELVVEVYRLTDEFPRSELYGLVSQMRRASVSIPSNIAEGWRRKGDKEFNRYLIIAYGSGSELETQIEITRRLPFGATLNYTKVDSLLIEVMKMLNAMINK